MKSLSQARQDLWLMEEVFFGKKNGFFVEVGSADGIALSNTYLLERRLGWKGICVEANPVSFRELAINRTAKVVNICVDQTVGQVTFISNGLLGGIVSPDTDNKKENGVGTISVIETLPLVDLLEQHKAPKVIDYLSIDVEGAEMRVLGSFPFDQYKFLSISVERPSDELQSVLRMNGYVLVKIIPFLDNLYIHESHCVEYANNLARYSKAYFASTS